MKIAIVEDTFKWMDKIEDSVNHFFQDKTIEVEIDKYYDAESFLDAKKEYEIVYLDIELSRTNGSMNGMEALGRYKQIFPNSIAALVTVHEEAVHEGYFVEAYRYIYKRNLEDEIQEMLKMAIHRLDMSKKIKFYVVGKKEIEIARKNVIYIETYRRNVIVHTTKGNYINNETLKKWEQLLGQENCFMPHKSYLVNMKWVEKIGEKAVLLYNEEEVLLSSKRKKEIQIKFMEWHLGEKN